jgi:hypothetical protein
MFQFGAMDRHREIGWLEQWTGAPGAHDETHQRKPEKQGRIRCDPGNAVKSGLLRGGEHGWTILLHERLQSEVIVITAVDRSNQLGAHPIGVAAADVIALEQDLTATAGAHQAMTEIIESGRIVASASKDPHSDNQKHQLQKMLMCGESRMESRKHA